MPCSPTPPTWGRSSCRSTSSSVPPARELVRGPARGGRRAARRPLGRRRGGAPAALGRRGLALVPRHARARHRPRPGRAPGDGRPLHLRPRRRDLPHPRLLAAGNRRASAPGRRAGRRRRGRPRPRFGALARVQAGHWRDSESSSGTQWPAPRTISWPWTISGSSSPAGHDREAERYFRMSTRVARREWPAWFFLGGIQARSGDLDGALATLQRAAELFPDAEAVHNSLGVTLAKLGRTEEAYRSFLTAVRLKPASRKPTTTWDATTSSRATIPRRGVVPHGAGARSGAGRGACQAGSVTRRMGRENPAGRPPDRTRASRTNGRPYADAVPARDLSGPGAAGLRHVWPVTSHRFVAYDDDEYVVRNPSSAKA